MNEIWIVSDTHFGHSNILGFMHTDGSLIRGNRFSSVEEMDEHMIERWNSVVPPAGTEDPASQKRVRELNEEVIVAWCTDKSAWRSFRIDNVLGVSMHA
jgi:hypothetical protein